MCKYKCENHKIDLACINCVKAIIERHDAMRDYIECNFKMLGDETAGSLLEELGLKNDNT